MDLGLLFLLHQALTGTQASLTLANGPQQCPPCPTPPSAIYQIPLTDVKKFKELEIPIPIQRRERQEVTPRPVTVTIPPLTGEQLTNWWLEATQDIPVTSLPPGAR